jgi:predicted GNAT family acetyltransferase
MVQMEPSVVDNPAADRFEIRLDGEVAGYAEYQRTGSTVLFTHTVIEPRFSGRGLGSILVRGALDAARSAQASVLPLCPFVRSYIERHPDYVDLVPAGQRTRFGLAPASVEAVEPASE